MCQCSKQFSKNTPTGKSLFLSPTKSNIFFFADDLEAATQERTGGKGEKRKPEKERNEIKE